MMCEPLMTKNKIIRVEVVFPCHNRRELTLQCLSSLARIDKEGLEVHTIVVDDGSTDGTTEAIGKAFPEVEIVKGDGTLWFTEGTNVGVRAALKHNPDYVLTMNDDQIFDSGFLKFMVETGEAHAPCVVGSLLLLWDTPHKIFQVSPKWETLSGGWRHWIHQTIWTVPEKPWEVDIIVGNCVLIPARAIKENGLMDSKRYPNFGDAEYTPRLKKKGWKLIIDPRARVFCQPNTLPTYIRKMSYKEKFNALFRNLGHTHNIRRRFFATRDAAPNNFQGVIAFCAFYIRILLRKNIDKHSEKLQERPLSEIFGDKIVSK